MGLGQIGDVISGGYCIGCGGCVAAAPAHFRLSLSNHGTFQAAMTVKTSDEVQAAVSQLCPFSDSAADETQQGGKLFGAEAEADDQIGWHRSAWAARAGNAELYTRGTSGGMIRWFCSQLLTQGHVDGAVMVTTAAGTSGAPLFNYSICRTLEEIAGASRSAYYPVAANQVFAEMAARGGRYVFVGTPCFVKAARLLAASDARFAATLRYCIALFCGHLKSSFFGELMGRQMGKETEAVTRIDFRERVRGAPASAVAISVGTATGAAATAYYRDLFGADYGHGFFKYKACDYCDDIVGELADVSIGDAWLPQYLHQGTSAVVVRTPFMEELLMRAAAEGEIWTEELTAEAVVQSQAGNFRHRRAGLGYRLWKAAKEGRWAPRKRVVPGHTHLTPRQRRIQDLRARLREVSFSQWEACRGRKDAVASFIRLVRPLALRLDYLSSRTWKEKLTRLSFRILNRLTLLDAAKSFIRLGKRLLGHPPGGNP